MGNIVADLGVIAPIWLTAVAAMIILCLTVAAGKSKPSPDSGTHLSMVALAALVLIPVGQEATAPRFRREIDLGEGPVQTSDRLLLFELQGEPELADDDEPCLGEHPLERR